MLRRSPLDGRHREAGARMAEFGGWELPLDFGSSVAEHLACRHDAAMFDVSHLGTVRVDGQGAFDRVQAALTNDLGTIQPGRAQYSHLLDEGDGSVLDDLIVWWHADGHFDLVPNASQTDRVQAVLGGSDITDSRALLAVQGPSAVTRLASVWPQAGTVGRFRVDTCDWRGHRCTVAGTGYTGERGVEIAVPTEIADDLWTTLIEAGIRPAGLGARDTLRLEAGLPLHGHELGPGILPHDAGLGWVVKLSKPTFIGKRAILQALESADSRPVLRGIATSGRRPPRSGGKVLHHGTQIGTVTSGNFSPILEHGIAMGFVSGEIAEGSPVTIDLGRATLDGQIVQLPFVRRPRPT